MKIIISALLAVSCLMGMSSAFVVRPSLDKIHPTTVLFETFSGTVDGDHIGWEPMRSWSSRGSMDMVVTYTENVGFFETEGDSHFLPVRETNDVKTDADVKVGGKFKVVSAETQVGHASEASVRVEHYGESEIWKEGTEKEFKLGGDESLMLWQPTTTVFGHKFYIPRTVSTGGSGAPTLVCKGMTFSFEYI